MTTTGDDQLLIQRLRATRQGYDDERAWHRFLLDAYAGTGGFAGRVSPPISGYWGAASEIYAHGSTITQEATGFDPVASSSYLDRYPREDSPKFSRRTRLAQYTNFVEQIIDLRLSYLARKPMSYDGFERIQSIDEEMIAEAMSEGADDPQQPGAAPSATPTTPTKASTYRTPAALRDTPMPTRDGPAFFDDAGYGMPWSRLMTDVVRLRASVLGWMPLLIDSESTDGEELTVAQANERGIRPRAIPLWPANLLDFDTDEEGCFTWAKVLTSTMERPDPLEKGSLIERITIWSPDVIRVWEIETPQGTDPTKGTTQGQPFIRVRDKQTPNPIKRVPLIIFRSRPKTDDPVRGVSMVSSIAPLARRLFNYHSELDEHLRASTFSMLQVPVKGAANSLTPGGTATAQQTTTVGAGNALPVPADSTRDYKWLSPDAAVAEVYEKRISSTIDAMFRIARMKGISGHRTDAGHAAASGVSQAYEFADLERAIADSAQAFAASEQDALRLVLAMEGADSDECMASRVTPSSRFDVEELSKQIDEVMRAITLSLGPAANTEIKKRLVRQLLPNLDEERLMEIDAQLDTAEETAEAAADAMSEALANAELPPEGDAGGEDGAGPGQPPPVTAEPGQPTASPREPTMNVPPQAGPPQPGDAGGPATPPPKKGTGFGKTPPKARKKRR